METSEKTKAKVKGSKQPPDVMNKSKTVNKVAKPMPPSPTKKMKKSDLKKLEKAKKNQEIAEEMWEWLNAPLSVINFGKNMTTTATTSHSNSVGTNHSPTTDSNNVGENGHETQRYLQEIKVLKSERTTMKESYEKKIEQLDIQISELLDEIQMLKKTISTYSNQSAPATPASQKRVANRQRLTSSAQKINNPPKQEDQQQPQQQIEQSPTPNKKFGQKKRIHRTDTSQKTIV